MKYKRLSLTIIPLLSVILMLFSLSACTQGNTGASAEIISESEAKKIALEDCGEKEEDIIYQKISLDTDDGIKVYEYDFDVQDFEYEYEINAETGKIIKKSKETRTNTLQPSATQAPAETTAAEPVATDVPSDTTVPPQPEEITLEQAKGIALADSGISKDMAVFTKQEKDTDEQTVHYDIEFFDDKNKYEYEIDLKGNIIKREKEALNAPVLNPEPNDITLEQAKDIALKDSGANRDKAVFTKQEKDFDGQKAHYEIEFYDDANEYEYEIDLNGNIIKRETEPLRASSAGQYITADEAIAAALSHAGLTLNQVTEVKAEFEAENTAVYEVEFRSGYTEYEYVINAADGSVISFKSDIDD